MVIGFKVYYCRRLIKKAKPKKRIKTIITASLFHYYFIIIKNFLKNNKAYIN